MVNLMLVLVLVSHLCASIGFWKSLRSGIFPKCTYCATASFLVYYDLGILAELLGYPATDKYFPSITSLDADTEILLWPMLALAPWLLLLGSYCVRPKERGFKDYFCVIPQQASVGFYLLATAASMALAAVGLRQLLSGASLWAIRSTFTNDLGVFVVLLFVPLYIVGFYVSTSDSRTPKGTCYLGFLVVCSILASIPTGERITALLPILIVLVFRFRLSVLRILGSVTALVVIATVMLTFSKSQFAGMSVRHDNLLLRTVHTDLSRVGATALAVQSSEQWGTRILPYPGSGYVYALLYPIPRQLAPFKGRSTSHEFTGYILGDQSAAVNWDLALGMVPNLLLNFGVMPAYLGFLLYGVILGGLDRWIPAHPCLKAPSRVGALFLCGYDITSMVLFYGFMAGLGLVLETAFAPLRSQSQSVTPFKPRAPNYLRHRHQDLRRSWPKA